MKRSLIVMATLMTIARPAWAGSEEREIAIANMLGPLGDAIRWTKPTPGWNGGGDEIKAVRANCRESLAEAKKAGVRPKDEIKGWASFAINPKARKVGDQVVFAFADAAWYCDELDKKTAHWDLVLRLRDAQRLRDKVKVGLNDQEKKDIAPEWVADTYEMATRCKTALAAEQATGATSVEVEGATVTLADAAGLCDTIAAWGDLQKAAYAERVATVGAKYTAVGIKGDRLDLFVYYDDLTGWYLPGCKKSTMEPKALKAQKSLFQWLTDSYGTITIRKFSFKGDKYTITENQFDTESQAYRGCH